MNVLFKKTIAIIIFAMITLQLCSCGMEESYKEFYIVNIVGNNVNEYISSSENDFAKVENITIVPEIKEIGHGEFVVYISAYSASEPESVVVKDLNILVDKEIVLQNERIQYIELELSPNNVFEGTINGCTFTDDDFEIIDGQRFDLNIHVQVIKDDRTVSKDVSFKIQSKIYKSFIAPV